MAKTLKDFLWIQKEGIIIGMLWGLISNFAGLGMATMENVYWWHKVLILPTTISGYIPVTGVSAFAASIIIGGFIGMLADMVYKPKL